jgi:hypothetical protein
MQAKRGGRLLTPRVYDEAATQGWQPTSYVRKLVGDGRSDSQAGRSRKWNLSAIAGVW